MGCPLLVSKGGMSTVLRTVRFSSVVARLGIKGLSSLSGYRVARASVNIGLISAEGEGVARPIDRVRQARLSYVVNSGRGTVLFWCPSDLLRNRIGAAALVKGSRSDLSSFG